MIHLFLDGHVDRMCGSKPSKSPQIVQLSAAFTLFTGATKIGVSCDDTTSKLLNGEHCIGDVSVWHGVGSGSGSGT